LLKGKYRDHKVLEACFFDRPTLEVAEDLLDKLIVTQKKGEVCSGRIVETEAYLSEGDPACHAAGNITKRNSVMYGPAGTVYVYTIYGMHLCFNVVTEPEKVPAAVLIRAVEPVFGVNAMSKRRGTDKLRNLASGPGKLTQALGINIKDNNKCLNKSDIYILEGACAGDFMGNTTRRETARSPRIGISRAKDLKYRFFIRDNNFVSG
jgi:DNA-3-methyladenine glycosylase